MAIGGKRIDKICAFMVRHRVIVFLIVLAVAIPFSLGAIKLKSDIYMNELFPYDHPYIKVFAKFSRMFGTGSPPVLIAVKVKEGDIFNTETLTKISKMTREIELWDEVYRKATRSMASYSTKITTPKAKGTIHRETLMFYDIPETKEEMEKLRHEVYSLPLFQGRFVSDDYTAAMIYTVFKEDISYERVFEILRDLQKRYSDDNTTIHIIGNPMHMGWIYSHKNQIYQVFAISVFFMLIILFAVFRNLVGMIAPVALAVICTGLGLGFVGWTGLNFNPLLFVLVFLVGARMVSNAVQITHRYIEEYRAHADREEAAYQTMRTMWMPNTAAVATDTAGFLVLILAKIVYMQMIAIMMSFWMATIVISAVVVPIICSFLPMKADITDAVKRKKNGLLSRINTSVSVFSMGKGKYLVGFIAAALLVTGIYETTKLKVGDPSPASPIFWADHPINQDQGLINRLFSKASSDSLVLYYEGSTGSIYDPEVLLTFQKFDDYMYETLPDIYRSSISIITLISGFQQLFRDGDPVWAQFPRDPEITRGIVGFLRIGGASSPARGFMDVPEPARHTQIVVSFADHTSDNMLRIKKAAYDFFEKYPMRIKNGEFLLAGGTIGMEIALNEEMKNSHALMDIAVLMTIFIMCTLAFRSFMAGTMLVVPLILSNLMAFSYMAIANIGLSTNTLPCSAVGVGVGVDFAIYLYSRCIEEYPNHAGYKETIITAVKTAGSGIIVTGLTLILPVISWYFISGLKFQAQMGFFLAMLLLINMIAALTLHPLLIFVIKPKFIQKRAAARDIIEQP